MGNNMNCDNCSANSRNMMHQRDMMYQRDMRMARNQMNARHMNSCDDDCSRERDMLYGVPLAMGYVPWQNFECTYEPAQALQAGTIFPELDKPFYGKRGMR